MQVGCGWVGVVFVSTWDRDHCVVRSLGGSGCLCVHWWFGACFKVSCRTLQSGVRNPSLVTWIEDRVSLSQVVWWTLWLSATSRGYVIPQVTLDLNCPLTSSAELSLRSPVNPQSIDFTSPIKIGLMLVTSQAVKPAMKLESALMQSQLVDAMPIPYSIWRLFRKSVVGESCHASLRSFGTMQGNRFKDTCVWWKGCPKKVNKMSSCASAGLDTYNPAAAVQHDKLHSRT
jgi:hypothetical protein